MVSDPLLSFWAKKRLHETGGLQNKKLHFLKMKNVSKIDHVILKMLMMAQRPTWGLLLPGVCLFDSKAFCQSNGSYQLSTPVWSQLHTPVWWRKDLHIYIYTYT
jgi:hypothetical protein